MVMLPEYGPKQHKSIAKPKMPVRWGVMVVGSGKVVGGGSIVNI